MTDAATRAEQLREEFEASFANAPAVKRDERRDLLAIRVGRGAFALHLADVKGLFLDKPITSLPTPISELLGIASFRGGLVAVYDLRALLGFETTGSARGLVLVSHRGKLVGLAFDALEGHRRELPEAFAPAEDRHVREVLKTETDARAIVDVASVLAAIEGRAVQVVRKER